MSSSFASCILLLRFVLYNKFSSHGPWAFGSGLGPGGRNKDAPFYFGGSPSGVVTDKFYNSFSTARSSIKISFRSEADIENAMLFRRVRVRKHSFDPLAGALLELELTHDDTATERQREDILTKVKRGLPVSLVEVTYTSVSDASESGGADLRGPLKALSPCVLGWPWRTTHFLRWPWTRSLRYDFCFHFCRSEGILFCGK